MYDAFVSGVEQAKRELAIATSTLTLIGVEILFEPSILIKAEVTAIID